MMKIVVVGGGNIGTLLYAELARINIDCEVILATRDKGKWGNSINVLSQNKELLYSINNINVTQDIVTDADYYFFTIPKNHIKETIEQYAKVVKEGANFIFVPGTGGVEFLYAKAQHIDFVGMQRVPYIARIDEYGKSVCMLSKKEEIFAASVKHLDVGFLNKMLGIKVVTLPNYLCVTMTPSNPILHTSRLFGLFSDNNIGHIYSKNMLFYESWDNKSSEMLIGADDELQKICKQISQLDLSWVKSLQVHYESNSVEAMTQKLSTIQAFKGIKSPMLKVQNGYIIDKDSRYFLEDFDYGLVILKALAQIVNVDTPYMNKILYWFENVVNRKILDNDKLVRNDKWLIPQNYGIEKKEDLVAFYSK